jgi:hypothetical protein
MRPSRRSEGRSLDPSGLRYRMRGWIRTAHPEMHFIASKSRCALACPAPTNSSYRVQVDQIAREKDIERIVRRRTLSVFLSRCRAHPSSFALEPRSGEDEVRLDLLKPQ